MMTSTGLYAENNPENIALREPTKENMDFLTPEQAEQRWGSEDRIKKAKTLGSPDGD